MAGLEMFHAKEMRLSSKCPKHLVLACALSDNRVVGGCGFWDVPGSKGAAAGARPRRGRSRRTRGSRQQQRRGHEQTYRQRRSTPPENRPQTTFPVGSGGPRPWDWDPGGTHGPGRPPCACGSVGSHGAGGRRGACLSHRSRQCRTLCSRTAPDSWTLEMQVQRCIRCLGRWGEGEG